jgi:hypothetical protein
MIEPATPRQGLETQMKRLFDELDSYAKSNEIDPEDRNDIISTRRRLKDYVRELDLDSPLSAESDPLFQALTDMSYFSYQVGRYCGKNPVVGRRKTEVARKQKNANDEKRKSEQRESVIACVKKLMSEDPSVCSDIDLLARKVESELFRENREKNKEESPPERKIIIKLVREAGLVGPVDEVSDRL